MNDRRQKLGGYPRIVLENQGKILETAQSGVPHIVSI
jgi:hypothetical protein